METWEQTWLIMPLDSGGILITGKGGKVGRTIDTTATTATTTDSSKVVRTASEQRSDSVRTVQEKPPNRLPLRGFWARLLLVLITVGTCYLLVKLQKRD